MSTRKAILGSIGAIFTLMASQILSQLVGSGLIFIHLPQWIGNTVAGILYVIITYFLLWLFAKKCLKIELECLNIPRFSLRVKWIIVGLLLPIIITGIYLFLPGDMLHNDVNVMNVLSVGVVFTGFAAGFVEEMVFRGVILGLLEKRWNKWIAVIVPSVLFGVVHVLGMDFSLGSILLVIAAGTMVGVMFSVIVLYTNSVWNSGIVHGLWNVIIIGGILQISNVPDENAIYNYVLHSNSYAITGGDFGIESSVIALAGYILVTVSVCVVSKKKI